MEPQIFDSLEQPDINTVRSMIYEAFANITNPGDDNLVEFRGPDYAVDDAYEALVGKSWNQVYDFLATADLKGMVPYSDAMFYITPLAFAYYLPALMLVSLVGTESNASLEDSLYFLLSASDTYGPPTTPDRIKHLTAEQKSAVMNYLLLKRWQDAGFDDSFEKAIDFWKAEVAKDGT